MFSPPPRGAATPPPSGSRRTHGWTRPASTALRPRLSAPLRRLKVRSLRSLSTLTRLRSARPNPAGLRSAPPVLGDDSFREEGRFAPLGLMNRPSSRNDVWGQGAITRPWADARGHDTQRNMKHDEKPTYNGWSNYETWAVNLWLSNEEGSYRYWTGRTREVIAETADDEDGRSALSRLAEELKESVHEECAIEKASLAGDLMNAVLGEVDWCEIARSLIDDETPPAPQPSPLFPLGVVVATPGRSPKWPTKSGATRSPATPAATGETPAPRTGPKTIWP